VQIAGVGEDGRHSPDLFAGADGFNPLSLDESSIDLPLEINGFDQPRAPDLPERLCVVVEFHPA